MKKLISIALAAILLAALTAGCGAPPANTAPKDNAPATQAPADQEAGAKAPRVVLAVAGTLGDKSYFDSANEGIEAIKAEYGCETKVLEMGTDQSKFASSYEDLIDEGWDLIIVIGINAGQPMLDVAAKYPEQKFILVDELIDFSNGQNANVFTMNHKTYEGSYLIGALAALCTSSSMPNMNPDKAIGFVGGMDIPVINDFLVGYLQGAKSVDPDVKVTIGYISSFTDAAKGKEIGLSMFNTNVDAVYQAAGGAGLGALDAAAETGKYAFGTDADQSELFKADEKKANAILASMLKRVGNSIRITVKDYMDGALKFGTNRDFGTAEDCIAITDTNQWYTKNVPQDIQKQVADIKAKVKSGEIKVKTFYEMSEEEFTTLKDSVKP